MLYFIARSRVVAQICTLHTGRKKLGISPTACVFFVAFYASKHSINPYTKSAAWSADLHILRHNLMLRKNLSRAGTQ